MKPLLFYACMLGTTFLYGQDSTTFPKKGVKWLLKLSTGYSSNISSFYRGDLYDELVGYSEKGIYFQPITSTWFIRKNWGLEISIKAAPSQSSKKEKIIDAIQKEYDTRYFTNPDVGASYGSVDNNNDRTVITGYLGVVYKIERRRWVIMPKLMAGLLEIQLESKDITLKERNKNSFLNISIKPEKKASDGLSIAPGITVAYMLKKRIFLNIDLQYDYARTNISYIRKDTDLASETIQYETVYKYPTTINAISLGVGIMFQLH